jgi:hypothetical protein
MTIGVIDLTFLNITENLIGLRAFLELGLSLFIIRIPVGMILHGKGPISLLYLTTAGIPAY